tara:strand:- start:300 stop:605 length:306 start_codon:yes stop_codon:yes gene_type:complete
MKNPLYLQGIFNETVGLRDQALAELSTYFENPAGVGEHSDISVELKKKIERVSHLDGVLETLARYYGNANKTDSPEGEASSDEIVTADGAPTFEKPAETSS